MRALKEVAEKHGEQGQHIMNSAYDGTFRAMNGSPVTELVLPLANKTEIKEILKKKSEEAKKVGEQAAQDAKKQGTK